MILVVGATGMTGSDICGKLTAQGKQVRALARETADAAKVERLRSMGVEIVTGDLRDAASLDAACRGVDAVITTASAMPVAYVPEANTPGTTDRDGMMNLVDAARAARARHFVHTSFPEYDIAFPLQDAKRAAEAHLRGSGLTHTILRPTFFMEVWLSPIVGFDYLNRKATIYGEGKNPISWISFHDVADFAVAALENPAARNTTLTLGGPAALTPLEVVSIFEKVGGKPWEYVNVPVEALQAQHSAASDPLQKSFAGLMLGYATGSKIDMAETLKAFPVGLTPVEAYARQVLAVAPSEAVA
jgi:uncharacterized protein YbjT (DUF2867 family)